MKDPKMDRNMKALSIGVRILLGLMITIGTIWLSGCGHYICHTTLGNSTCTPSGGGLGSGGGGNISQTAFEYFTDDEGVGMAAEGLNVGGDQSFLPMSSFVSPPTLPQGPLGDGGMIVLKKEFLYMAFSDNTVFGFTIDGSTGALTPISGASGSSPFTVLAPSSMAADPAGGVLFVAGSAGITGFTVNSTDGSLTQVGSPVATAGLVSQMTMNGLGTYLYAVEPSGVYAYANTGGVLTPAGGPFQAMAQIAGETTGNYIVGITAQDGTTGGIADNNVYLFTIQAGGALSTPTAIPTQNAPIYLAVSPTAPFVYTFEDDTPDGGVTINIDPIEGFQLSGGSLNALGATSLTAIIGKFDQSGDYLFVDGFSAGFSASFVYAADTSSGTLTSTIPHIGWVSDNFAVTDAP